MPDFWSERLDAYLDDWDRLMAGDETPEPEWPDEVSQEVNDDTE